MIKKIAVISALALVLAIGVFGTVNTTHAQQIEVDEAPATQEEAAFEYQYTYQYGDEKGEVVSIMTQTQARTQMGEVQEGECDGEPLHTQLRQQLNVNQNEMRQLQQNKNLRDGSCNGECVSLRQGGQGN